MDTFTDTVPLSELIFVCSVLKRRFGEDKEIGVNTNIYFEEVPNAPTIIKCQLVFGIDIPNMMDFLNYKADLS